MIGQENLLKPAIQLALAEALRVHKQKLDIRTEHVLAGLLREANTRSKDLSSAGARVRAWELIGKHIGMFQERITILHRLDRLSDRDLADLEGMEPRELARALGLELLYPEAVNGR